MATFTRTETDVLGSHASPSTIAANGSSTTTALDLTGTNTADGMLTVNLIIGSSAPTTPPTVAFAESLDGTNYETVVTIVCVNATSTRYSYPYAPSAPAVKKVQATITNGATNSITAYAQANTRSVT